MHARRIVNKFDCNEHVNCAVKKRKAKGAGAGGKKATGDGQRERGVLHVLALFCALRCVFVFRNNACFFSVCRFVVLLFFY